MKRITLIGNSGAGKSTLADKLGTILKLPVHHLDLILWKENWECTDEKQFTESHDKILKKDSWIIEGVAYWSCINKRFKLSDTIIFLDFSPAICKKQAKKRIQMEQKRPDPYISEKCSYQNKKKEQDSVINNFHSNIRPKIKKLLKELDKKDIRILYIKSKRELAKFLKNIEA
jgi:adenylate kinase family enzyme